MFLNIKVKTRADKNEVEKISDNTFIVKVTAVPEKGKANEMVIDLLSKFLKIPKSKLKIIAGTKFKEKIIAII